MNERLPDLALIHNDFVDHLIKQIYEKISWAYKFN